MSRSWQLIRLAVPHSQLRRFSQHLAALGTLGVEERPVGAAPALRQPWDPAGPAPAPPAQVELLAYFERDGEQEARTARLAEALRAPPGGEISVGVIEEGDWEERWRSSFKPFSLAGHGGARVTIAPPWNAPAGCLRIEPGMAFGTGEHPSTRACLRAVARHARPGASLLDVGCGTGVIALLGARLGMRAEGIDNDPDAVRAAQLNGRRNDLPCRFDGRPLVAANLFAEAIGALGADLRRLTGRRLILAGILADRVALVQRALRPLALCAQQREGEWVSLQWRRP